MKQQKMKSELKQKLLHVKCKRSLSVLCISVFVLMMTGCVQSTALVIPANLKQPCPDLQKLESGQGKDVLPVMVDDRRKYVECANKVEAWIRLAGE